MIKKWIVLGNIAVLLLGFMVFNFTSDNPLSNEAKAKKQTAEPHEKKEHITKLTDDEKLIEKYKDAPKDIQEEGIAAEEEFPVESDSEHYRNIAFGFSESVMSGSQLEFYDGIAVNVADSYFPPAEQLKGVADRGRYIFNQISNGHKITNVELFRNSLENDSKFEMKVTFTDQDDTFYNIEIDNEQIVKIEKEE